MWCFALSFFQRGPAQQRAIRFAPLPNGIDIRAVGVQEQITALRDDLLRVRIVRSGGLPEDASWAVLPEREPALSIVTPEITSGAAGFRTNALRVVIDRKTLRMTIFDRVGNVLNEDARRSQFR